MPDRAISATNGSRVTNRISAHRGEAKATKTDGDQGRKPRRGARRHETRIIAFERFRGFEKGIHVPAMIAAAAKRTGNQIEAQIVDDPPRQTRRKLLISIADCRARDQAGGQPDHGRRRVACPCQTSSSSEARPQEKSRGAKNVQTTYEHRRQDSRVAAGPAHAFRRAATRLSGVNRRGFDEACDIMNLRPVFHSA